MSELNESKIEMTKRLQREGLWDEATEFRCDERRRLRASGMPRDEANDRAWESMGEKFPSPENIAAFYLAAAKSAPLNCGSPEFADVWYGFLTVPGSIDTPDVSIAIKAYKQAVKDAPSEAARQILDGNRLEFFDLAERVFTAEIERRKADPSEINGSVASELGRYVDRLPALREVFSAVA